MLVLEPENNTSATNTPIIPHLAEHAFPELFIEILGWDRAVSTLTLEIGGRHFDFHSIAHKRGFQILHCRVNRVVLSNRTLLRRLQKQLSKSIHEHIIIYSSEEPRKQVWQWAIRLPDGRRWRHREHPFFSESPPTALVSRIQGLGFTLEEEEAVTLVSALDRVRQALDTMADLNLFVRRPQYAEKSDRFADAMKKGGLEELHRFIVFHRHLAKWFARRFHHRYGMDIDDAEQAAMMGIIRAAESFDPSRGFQFSTYASYWIKQTCRRFVAPTTLMIRVPEHTFWPCRKLRARMNRLASHGPECPKECLDHAMARDRKITKFWQFFEQATSVRSLSERKSPEFAQACSIPDASDEPIARFLEHDLTVEVHEAIGKLPPDDAVLVRMRYGFDGEPMTLQAIGEKIGRTRERVRQRMEEIEDRLRRFLTEN